MTENQRDDHGRFARKLPRPTRSLPPCGGRSLLEGRAFSAAPLCPATPCGSRERRSLVIPRDRRSRSLTKGASRLSNDMGAARLPLTRPRCGRRVGAVLRPAYRSRAVDCPADLIAGGRLVRPRLQGARPSGLAPQVPVYSWHLPTPTCARTAVPYGMGRKRLSLAGLPSFATRFLPGLLARSARSLRPGAPRYHVLNGKTGASSGVDRSRASRYGEAEAGRDAGRNTSLAKEDICDAPATREACSTGPSSPTPSRRPLG